MKRKKSTKEIAARRAARRQRRNIRATMPAPQPTAAASFPRWALTGVLAMSAAVGGLSSPLFAQAPTTASTPAPEAFKRYDIPGGRLSTVLEGFSRITGITVTDPSGVIGLTESVGVTGMQTTDRALRRLLSGTGITYKFTNPRSIALERGRLPQLAAVAVVAERQTAVKSEKYAGPLRDVPQTITVVPKNVLESQGVTSLRDAVRNVTGLTVNAGEGGATPGDNFNIRGFSARSDVFVDGMRDAGGYSRETFNVEQIEVSKGPGSVYSGRGSTGGSINIVTKSPHLIEDYSGALGAGSAQYGRVTLDVNKPIGAIEGSAVRVNAQVQNAGVANVDVVKNKSWGVSPSVAFGLGSPTQLSVNYFQARQDNIPTYGVADQLADGPPAGVDTHKFYGLKNFDFEHVDAKQATAKLSHDFGDGLTLRNQTSWGSTDVQRMVTSGYPDKTRKGHSHITYDQNLSNQTSLTNNFRMGGIQHSVASGVEATHEKSRFAAYVLSKALPNITDLLNPNPNDVYTGTMVEGKPRRSAIANTVGVYSFDTMKLGSEWEVNLGLRWDSFSPQYRDSLDREQPKKDSKALTWRGGLVYKPIERASFYVAYGTSFNPTGELLSLDSRGTLGLEPEQNKSYEIGTKWELFGARLLMTAAGFRTDKTNARIADPLDPSGTTIILAGQQRVTGGEIGATGKLTDRWSLFAGYAYLDGKILTGAVNTAGTPLPNTPKHSLNIWSTANLPGNIEVGGGARFVDDRYRIATQTVPSYWSYDADAAYTVSSQIQLRLNLINLTDATYYDSGRYWVPAAGRSVKLSTSLKL